MNNTASAATTLQNMQHHVALCQNLDYQTAIKAHIQKLYQMSVILISLDLRISRIMQKYMHNHENPLIMKIMVLTIILTMAAHAQITTLADLQDAITNAADGETIEITDNITVDELITIPDGTNIILTGEQLTRGINGILITVASGGSLTLQDITIDGNKSAYSGLLIYLNGGSLIMNSGAVLQNNTVGSSGGGVWIAGGTFTMNGGEIKNNNAAMAGGGVDVLGGTFIMNGGEISGNNAQVGGGVTVNGSNPFTVGGTAKITGNTASNKGNNLYLSGSGSGAYIMLDSPALGMEIGVSTYVASGVIVENGATAEDAKYFFADEAGKTVAGDGAGLKIVADEDVRTISYDANNGIGTMASDKVAEGSSYTIKPNAFTQTGYTFTSWNTEPDGNGIDHEEGEESPNVTADITLYAKWVEVTSSSSSEAEPSSSSEEPSSSSSGDNTPIRLPQIANAPISIHATSNAIILQNLPSNAKVEVYNLQGKRIYMNNPENPLILKIMVQTKGIYIVKVNKNTLLVTVM